MPKHVADKIDNILKDISGRKKITILGITYKQDVDDLRESPIIYLMDLLKGKDYEISVVDPNVNNSLYNTEKIITAAEKSDLILLGVNHKEFASIDFSAVGTVMRNKNLLDTRNFLDGDKLATLGFNYYLLGHTPAPE
jgi:UDP-N-acetyl-D-mannosaminuronic acid dehydrogenase